MTAFWVLDATGSQVDPLERPADAVGTLGWGMEFDGDLLLFWFADEEERGVFIFRAYVGDY